ncbi:MAG: TlpA disulfide reductase family protein [Saprospiraceae bacterium]|nr:TlpA disulfide reductase family protein [Saprospiraceae bacterium]
MKQTIWLIAIALCSWAACNEAVEAPTTATITGTVTNAGEIESVQLLWSPVIGERKTVAEADLGEDGSFALNVETTEPMNVSLRIGKESTAMFIHPGDVLTVSVDAEEFDETITYSGVGADVNNYLAAKYLKEEQYKESLEESKIYKLELEDFLATHNGLHDMLQSHFNETFEGKEVSEAFRKFEETELLADWALTLENYPDYHGYYGGKPDFEVEDSYYDFRKKIDLTDAGAVVSPAYRSYLRGYSGRKLNALVEADSTLRDDWPTAYRAVYKSIAKDDQLGEDVKQYVMASQLQDYMTFFGTEGVEELIEGFRQQDGAEDYMATLDNTYAQWSKIAEGQPAPDFTYTSIDGEQVSFSDFKGKIVYLDVWATWCGPCKAEMPHAKKLKEKYADNPSVVFMYVSVDEDKEKWEKFLADDPEFTGVHLITGTGWESDLTDAYMIKGIPRYILVDQQGKIVSASAPRPSSGEKIEGMINELLEAGEISG